MSSQIIDIESGKIKNYHETPSLKQQINSMTYTNTCEDTKSLEMSCFSPQFCKQLRQPTIDDGDEFGIKYIFMLKEIVVGYIIVSDPPFHLNNPVSSGDKFISDFCIAYEYRGAGYGSFIMNKICEMYKTCDLILTVHVIRGTPRDHVDRIVLSRSLMLLPFYKKFGFNVIKFGSTFVAMKKKACRKEVWFV